MIHRACTGRTQRSVWTAVLMMMSLGAASRGGEITEIVAFGDSLSDVGNTYLAAGVPSYPVNPAPGRYSNGPIWLDYLAARLGIAAPTPSLAGGTDNAWGGAQTGDGLSFMGTPNTGMQISTYLASSTLNSHQLITLWAGANDFLNGGVTDPTIPLANIAAEITTLAAAGGKLFLVPNLPLLGELPATNVAPDPVRQGLNQLTLAFNSGLHDELNGLQSTLGVTILQLDVNAVFQQMIADPGAFGLTNVTDSAIADGVLSGQGYLFWDPVHPTTAVQEMIGNVAYAMVPEPSSIFLCGAGGGVLLVWWSMRGLARIPSRRAFANRRRP